MFIGRMHWLLVSSGLVVTGRDALRSDVKMPAVRHSFGYNAEGSSFHDVELNVIHTDSAEMFRTIECAISKSKKHKQIFVFANNPSYTSFTFPGLLAAIIYSFSINLI